MSSIRLVRRPCWTFETRKIPALEWLAVKLENAVHSIGLCPGWNCCAADGLSTSDHPSQNRTASRGATRIHHGHHSRQATHQFRSNFHRLANNNSSTTATTVNTNTTVSHAPSAVCRHKITDNNRPSKSDLIDEDVSDSVEPVTAIENEPIPGIRSEWVWLCSGDVMADAHAHSPQKKNIYI